METEVGEESVVATEERGKRGAGTEGREGTEVEGIAARAEGDSSSTITRVRGRHLEQVGVLYLEYCRNSCGTFEGQVAWHPYN